MKNKQASVNLAAIEGRSFIVGREGHIYIDSPLVSKQHAEFRIIDGRIHLRDLDSTNGTFLVDGKAWVRFDKGFVNPRQSIAIGGQVHRVGKLLAIASDFAAIDDADTEIELPTEPARQAAGGSTP